MNYAVGHCFNVDDMFYNFNYKKLDMNCDDCERINGVRNRDKLVKKIFREGLKLVLNDIVDNNITFELPTGSKKADIHVRRTHGEDFKRAYRNGKWNDVDYIASNFSGNELVLDMKSGGRTRTKIIHVDKNIKNKITKYTNEGKLYC